MNTKKKTGLKVLAGIGLSFSIMMSVSPVLNTMHVNPVDVHAATGTNGSGSLRWGNYFNNDGWVFIDGEEAFCLQFGAPSPSGESMTEVVRNFSKDNKTISLYTHGYKADVSGLTSKHGVTQAESKNVTAWMTWALANEMGIPQPIVFSWEAFEKNMTLERPEVQAYARELMNLVRSGSVPNVQISVTPTSSESKYNSISKRLETGEYIANVDTANPVTFSNLPPDIFVINAKGEKVTQVAPKEAFKFATNDLSKSVVITNIDVSASVKEVVPIVFQSTIPGNQDVIFAKLTDPLKTVSVSAKFVPATGNIKFIKIDKEEKTPVSDMKFVLKDKSGKIIKETVSNKLGIVEFKGILLGEYTVIETPVLGDGYIDESLSFPVTVKAGETVSVKEVENKKNEIELSKLDNENNKPVKNAKVELINKDGKTVWSGDGNSKIKGIPAGEYTLKETIAPERYILNPETTKVVITEDGKVSVGIIHDETRDITVVKRDGNTGTKLKDAEFELQTLDGKVFEMLDKDNNIVPAVLKTNENGEARFRGLPVGDYKVVEKTAPTGYTINSDLSVKADEKMDTKYDFVDYRIPETPKIPTIPVYDFLPKTGAEIGGIAIEQILVGGSGLGSALVAIARRFKK